MNTAHALILPSRFDGWGVVVNEALSVGVPVIVSDTCGAADLVHHGENGYVFVSQNSESLRTCLKNFLAQDENKRLEMRRAARATGESISTKVVAPYLVQCLQHMLGQISDKPLAPWKL